ncbi:MAG: hypothetical protein LBM96_00670 [Methanobrevibacter sp.]|jgi:hypothetical protein|nr:hypothetical protein [Candidatus Methanoflexus mossambicus]
MAKLSIVLNVNTNVIKTLQKNLENVVAQIKTLNGTTIGTNVNNSGVSKLQDELNQSTQMAEELSNAMGKAGDNVNPNKFEALKQRIDETRNMTEELSNLMSKIGRPVDTAGLSNLQSKINLSTKMAQELSTAMGKASENVDTAGLTNLQSKINLSTQMAEQLAAAIGKSGENVDTSALTKLQSEINAATQMSEELQATLSKTGKSVDDSGVKSLKGELTSTNQMAETLISTLGGIGGAIGLAGIGDLTIGNAMTKETNKVLLYNSGVKDAGKLWENVDNITNTSLMTMNAMVPVLTGSIKALRLNDMEANKMAQTMGNLGTMMLGMGKSEAEVQTRLQGISKGMKGAYALLDDFGVTEDTLLDTGLWNGSEDDVMGFLNALEKVTNAGKMSGDMMNTTEGQLALLRKQFSIAGASIGKEILPWINKAIDLFMQLSKATGGMSTKVIVGFGAIASAGLMLKPILELGGGLGGLGKVFGGFGKGGGGKGGGAGIKSFITQIKTFGNMVPQLVVPLLKIAGVTAIILPVVTGLIAEMALLAKGLQLLVKWLNFEGIDLSKSINSLKQLMTAIATIGGVLAIGAVSNVANVGYIVTGGILNTISQLGQLKIVAESIKNIELPAIDPSIVTKLQTLITVFKSLSTVMGGMSSVNWSGFVFKITGGITGLDTNIANVKSSVKSLTAVDSLPPVNVSQKSIDNLKKIAEMFKSLSTAMGGMSSVNWSGFTFKITGGIEGLNTNIGYIKTAVTSLNGLSGIAPVNVVPQLGIFGRNITSLSNIMKILSSIAWESLITALMGLNLSGVVTTIWNGMTQTNRLAAAISHDVTPKLIPFNRNIIAIKNIIPTLNSVGGMGGSGINITGVVSSIWNGMSQTNRLAVATVHNVVAKLGTYNRNIISLKNVVSNSKGLTGTIANISGSIRNIGVNASAMGKLTVANLNNSLKKLPSTVSVNFGAANRQLSSSGSVMASNARSQGAKIVASFKAGLGIGSPGYMARMVQKEFQVYMPSLIQKHAKPVLDQIEATAEKMKDKWAKTNETNSPGYYAKLMGIEVGQYIPLVIASNTNKAVNAMTQLATNLMKPFTSITESAFLKYYKSLSDVSEYAKKVTDYKNQSGGYGYATDFTKDLNEAYKAYKTLLKSGNKSQDKIIKKYALALSDKNRGNDKKAYNAMVSLISDSNMKNDLKTKAKELVKTMYTNINTSWSNVTKLNSNSAVTKSLLSLTGSDNELSSLRSKLNKFQAQYNKILSNQPVRRANESLTSYLKRMNPWSKQVQSLGKSIEYTNAQIEYSAELNQAYDDSLKNINDTINSNIESQKAWLKAFNQINRTIVDVNMKINVSGADSAISTAVKDNIDETSLTNWFTDYLTGALR